MAGVSSLALAPAVAPHSRSMPDKQQPDRRVGQRLTAVTQVRLTPAHHAYLQARADELSTGISEEIRRCVEEAMVASWDARRRRHAEYERAVRAIASGEAGPEDFPQFFEDVARGPWSSHAG